jgi:putative peptide zinc metalloprotease protein
MPELPAPRSDSQRSPGDALRLLPGAELLGPVEGSGLHEPPHYVRRPDGQVVQLSRLLFIIAEHAVPGTSLEEIAERAGSRLDLRIRPEQVRYILEEKLHRLGVVAGPDGSIPKLERVDPLLALKFRIRVVGPRAVRAIAAPLSALFATPIVVAVLAALLGFDVWLLAVHGGIGRGLSHVIAQPSLTLMLLVVTYASLAFHECGHAAACRRGGAQPGAIGLGVYLVWPVLFSDVTDSYRLGKRGRLRTDLGGVYFNCIFAVLLAVAYATTRFEPLLLAVMSQHLIVLDQFLPWVRLDGYYVVADLIGVSDLFSRIRPILRSLLPGRRPGPRVTELKPWARAAVTAWVLTTVTMLMVVTAVMIVRAPAYFDRMWTSVFVQADVIGRAIAAGDAVAVAADVLGNVLLVLSPVGLAFVYVLLCRRLGAALALSRERRVAVAHRAAVTR